MKSLLTAPLLLILATTACAAQEPLMPPDTVRYIDTDREYFIVGNDTVHLRFDEPHPTTRSGRLTEQDFEEVAAELGVEVAAIKAVTEVEAGRTHQGFWTEGKPVLNFDLTIYRNRAAKRKVNLAKHPSQRSIINSRPNIKRYGSQQAGQQARFDAAAAIDSISAIEGVFWGMFQIGGFNYKLCGTKSHQDFFNLMSRSERDQLELFAEFITRAGLLPALKSKNWSAFARGYNGPSYAARGYHTKLARAYARHKKSGK